MRIVWLLTFFGSSALLLASSEATPNSKKNKNEKDYRETTFYFGIPSYQCTPHLKTGLLQLLNDERQSKGWHPLTESEDITHEAQAWALTNAQLGTYSSMESRFGQLVFNAAKSMNKSKVVLFKSDVFQYTPEMVIDGLKAADQDKKGDGEGDVLLPKIRVEGEIPKKSYFDDDPEAFRRLSKEEYAKSKKVGFGCSTYSPTKNSKAGSLVVIFFEYIDKDGNHYFSENIYENAIRPDPNPSSPANIKPKSQDVDYTFCDSFNDFYFEVPTFNASERFFQSILCIFNRLRQIEGRAPLSFDADANYYAQKWALTKRYLGDYDLKERNYGLANFAQTNETDEDKTSLEVQSVIFKLFDPEGTGNAHFRPQIGFFDWGSLSFKLRPFTDEEWTATRHLGVGVSTFRDPGHVTIFLTFYFNFPDSPVTTTTTDASTENPDDTSKWRVPTYHCSSQVQDFLLAAFNVERMDLGYAPLSISSKATSDAEKFAFFGHNNSIFKDPRYNSYAYDVWEKNLKTSAGSEIVIVSPPAEYLIEKIPPADFKTKDAISEEQWASLKSVGFGCLVVKVDDNDNLEDDDDDNLEDDDDDNETVYVAFAALFELEDNQETTTTEVPTTTVEPEYNWQMPVPTDTCSKKVSDLLFRKFNEKRDATGLGPLSFSSQDNADAKSFAVAVNNRNNSIWPDPKYAQYSFEIWANDYVKPKGEKTIGVNLEDAIDYFLETLPPLGWTNQDPISQAKWAKVTSIGFGCSSVIRHSERKSAKSISKCKDSKDGLYCEHDLVGIAISALFGTGEEPEPTTEQTTTTEKIPTNESHPMDIPTENCPRDVQEFLFGRIIDDRDHEGLDPLVWDEQYALDANDFSTFVYNESKLQVPAYQKYGFDAVAWTIGVPRQSNQVDVDLLLVASNFKLPSEVKDPNIDYTQKEWAETTTVGIGCQIFEAKIVPVQRLHKVQPRKSASAKGHKIVAVTFTAFFGVEDNTFPTTEGIPVDEAHSLPIPSNSCPQNVGKFLQNRLNGDRNAQGLDPLTWNDQYALDATDFSTFVYNSSKKQVPAYQKYGFGAMTWTVNVAEDADEVDVNLLLVESNLKLPSKMQTHKEYTEDEWAETNTIGIGCQVFEVEVIPIHPSKGQLKSVSVLDEKIVAINFAAFFGNNDTSTTTTTTKRTPTIDPSHDPPIPVRPNSKECPKELVDEGLWVFNKNRREGGLNELTIDLDETSALAQDYTNHHLSDESYHNVSFAGYGYGYWLGFVIPVVERNRTIPLYMREVLNEIVDNQLPPSRMGTEDDKFTVDEWKNTRIFGIGCTTWYSDRKGGKEIAPSKRKLKQDKIGINFALVFFFKSENLQPPTTELLPTTTDIPDITYPVYPDNHTCPKELAKNILGFLNNYRSGRNLPPLALDQFKTSELAQKYADSHLSEGSFNDPEFSTYGYANFMGFSEPAPTNGKPLTLPLRSMIKSLGNQIAEQPKLMGTEEDRFSLDEWKRTSIAGIGCTSWLSPKDENAVPIEGRDEKDNKGPMGVNLAVVVFFANPDEEPTVEDEV